MKKIIKFILSPFLGNKLLQPFFENMFLLSLKGMNIGGGAITETSGEQLALLLVLKKFYKNEGVVIFDVGANLGEYTKLVLKILDEVGVEANIYAFEPSAFCFSKLKEQYGHHTKIHLVNAAVGGTEGQAMLFSDTDGSGLASLVKRDLSHLGNEMNKQEMVKIVTLDGYCSQSGIDSVDFLKLDIEGNEFEALKGAQKKIAEGKISAIQFEFGGTDIDARVFFRDFYHLLAPSYKIYRILRNGLREISSYSELSEIFLTTNFLAIKK